MLAADLPYLSPVIANVVISVIEEPAISQENKTKTVAMVRTSIGLVLLLLVAGMIAEGNARVQFYNFYMDIEKQKIGCFLSSLWPLALCMMIQFWVFIF